MGPSQIQTMSRESFPGTTASLTAPFPKELFDASSAAEQLKLVHISLPDFLPPLFGWGRSHET